MVHLSSSSLKKHFSCISVVEFFFSFQFVFVCFVSCPESGFLLCAEHVGTSPYKRVYVFGSMLLVVPLVLPPEPRKTSAMTIMNSVVRLLHENGNLWGTSYQIGSSLHSGYFKPKSHWGLQFQWQVSVTALNPRASSTLPWTLVHVERNPEMFIFHQIFFLQ